MDELSTFTVIQMNWHELHEYEIFLRRGIKQYKGRSWRFTGKM